MASINWATVAKTGLSIAGIVFPQVNVIETVAKAIPGFSGKAKEDAAVLLVHQAMEAAEGLVGHELVNDPEVEHATRGLIEAYVALQNVLVKHPAVTSTK